MSLGKGWSMKVAVVGSYGVGMTMRVVRAPDAGQTLSGGQYSADHGGKGSNQAVAAARLGAEVSFLTAVGADENAERGRELWRTEGVDAVTVTPDAAATMVGFIIVDQTGENRIIIAPGALERVTAEDVERFRPQIANADIVVVSLEIALPAALAALRIGREEGTRTLLNPAPAAVIPSEAWAWIDVVTPNRTEAGVLGVAVDVAAPATDLAAALHVATGATVVLTLGGDGAVVADSGATRTVPAVAVPRVVDTTGAGDAFTGALAYALAAGQSVDVAAAFAAHAGAYAVGIADVIPALAHRTDLPGFAELGGVT